MSNILTILADLLDRAQYDHGRFLAEAVATMPRADKLAVENLLVSAQHPLAYQPGTQDWRVAAYAKELAALAAKGDALAPPPFTPNPDTEQPLMTSTERQHTRQQDQLFAVVNIATGERIGALETTLDAAKTRADGLNVNAREMRDVRRYQARDIDQALASDAERMSTLDESRHVATITSGTTSGEILAAIDRWAERDYHPDAVRELWAILGLVRGPDNDQAARRIKMDLTAVIRARFLPHVSAIAGGDTNYRTADEATADSFRSLANTLDDAGDFPGVNGEDAVARTQGFDWHYRQHAISAFRAAASILETEQVPDTTAPESA